MASENPLLQQWTGPYGGIPPLATIKVEHFAPALETSMAAYDTELKAIGDDTSAPSFDNTILALERAGQQYNRVRAMYGLWSSSLSTPDFQKVEQTMAPKLAGFADRINHDKKLWQRIAKVYAGRDSAQLNPEQQRLLWLYHTQFKQQGADLSDADKAQVSSVNQRLATLYTTFSQNILADEETTGLFVTDAKRLSGMSPEQIEAAGTEGKRRGKDGTYVIANTRSAMEPFLTQADDRELRKEAFALFTARGDNGNATDNNAIAAEILGLREKRSKLLGFGNYADWHLADTMARNPPATMELMLRVWEPAIAHVRTDVAAMEKVAGHPIEPWDYRYYAEKVRRAKYDLDFDEVKPYLQLDRLRDAMFFMAHELYGLRFTRVDDVAAYHPDVSTYRVTGRDGGHVGLFFFDPYARPGKNSGAWMSSWREQHRLWDTVPAIVTNNSNFIPGRAGEPVLLSWDDARTLFHEFGHALHGLCSSVTYPSLSGTNTTRDFVEFPSQFHENYLRAPEIRAMLVDTSGKPFPAALVEKIERAANFNEGFRTIEFLASAIVDMKMHTMSAAGFDAKTFEQETLRAIGMPREIVMRHRIPHFGHVFSGEGYAAGYYSYLWAEVIDHDAYQAFIEAGGPFDKATAERLHRTLMSVGNTMDPAEAYKAFRGREPHVDALLAARGLSADVHA